MAASAETQKDTQKLVRATVARGRSIEVPTTTKRVVGTTAEGTKITTRVCQVFGPDVEVELPEDDVIFLRATGYLLDPKTPLAPLAEGPHFTEQSR